MRSLIPLVLAAFIAACGGDSPGPTAIITDPSGFNITGNPEASAGTTWTFRGDVNGVTYDLTGVLRSGAEPGSDTRHAHTLSAAPR
jgi:hypothetical protein